MIRPSESFTGLNATICTTYDCNLRCKYDLAKGTKVLMADLTEKNIEDVQIGDKILGFDEIPDPNNGRNFKIAKVLDSQHTRNLTTYYKYESNNYSEESSTVELIASGEHPVLNEKDVFITTEEFSSRKNGSLQTIPIISLQNSVTEFDDVEEYEKQVNESYIIFKPITCEKYENTEELEFYNLTTTSGTFIANGILVHNCYEMCKRSVQIKPETAFKFIDRLLEDPDPIGGKGTADAWIPRSGLVLDFIGGDSFMQPKLMDTILTYFQYKVHLLNHPWKNAWRASISTNGTLFGNPDVQKLIDKWGENLSIGISIDGCPELHDANRIFTVRGKNGEELGTMSTIMKYWKWIEERNPDAVNHTKSTLSRNSIPWIYKSLVFMHSPYPKGLGITYVNQNFIMEDTGCQEDDYVLLDEELRRCERYVFDHRYELYFSMFDKQGLNHRSDNVEDFKNSIKKGWCGSGAMPSLGMNGKIYPCFRWLPHTMQEDVSDAETMCVGDATNGFTHKENFRRVKDASREKISSDYCLECEYEGACAYCIGGCYAENHEFKRTEHICDIAKIRSKWGRVYWDCDEEVDHNHDDYFDFERTVYYDRIPGTENKYIDNEKERKYGPDGRLKEEYRTPDNPTGEPKLTFPDLPPEYRNAWKYVPKRTIEEGEEFYKGNNAKADIPVINGKESQH